MDAQLAVTPTGPHHTLNHTCSTLLPLVNVNVKVRVNVNVKVKVKVKVKANANVKVNTERERERETPVVPLFSKLEPDPGQQTSNLLIASLSSRTTFILPQANAAAKEEAVSLRNSSVNVGLRVSTTDAVMDTAIEVLRPFPLFTVTVTVTVIVTVTVTVTLALTLTLTLTGTYVHA